MDLGPCLQDMVMAVQGGRQDLLLCWGQGKPGEGDGPEPAEVLHPCRGHRGWDSCWQPEAQGGRRMRMLPLVLPRAISSPTSIFPKRAGVTGGRAEMPPPP